MGPRAAVTQAQLVAELTGLTTGLGEPAPLRLLWHEPSRRWLFDLPYVCGVARPDSLRELADALLAAVAADEYPADVTIAVDGDVEVEVNVENGGEDGLSLYVGAFVHSPRHFAGVSRLGEALYASSVPAPYLEFHGEHLPQDGVAAAAHALRAGLAAHPEVAGTTSRPPAEVVAEFAGPPDTWRLRLVISREGADWFVGVASILDVPTDPDRLAAFAALLAAGAGETTLAAAERYSITARVGEGVVRVVVSAPDGTALDRTTVFTVDRAATARLRRALDRG